MRKKALPALIILMCIAALAAVALHHDSPKKESTLKPFCRASNLTKAEEQEVAQIAQIYTPTLNGSPVPPGQSAPPGIDSNADCRQLIKQLAGYLQPTSAAPVHPKCPASNDLPDLCQPAPIIHENPLPLDYTRRAGDHGPCTWAPVMPGELKAVLKDDKARGLPTSELGLRLNVRIGQPTGPCDFKAICKQFNRLSARDLIDVTNVVAELPYKIGDAPVHYAGAVIDPVNCMWGFNDATPRAMREHWINEYPNSHPYFIIHTNFQPRKPAVMPHTL